MKNTALGLMLVLLVSACSHKNETKPTPPTPQIQAAAQKSADEWLALVDAGNSTESWNISAAYFQTAITQDQWAHTIAGIRKPLGDLISRKFTGAEYTTSAPGAPDGEYVVLHFATSFAKKRAAVEIVTPMLDRDGKWKVSGYYIK